MRYNSLQEARKNARKHNFISRRDYLEKRSIDPLLPGSPNQVYKNEWLGWDDYLGSDRFKNYREWAEASNAAQKLKIISRKDYLKKKELDPRLPSEPEKAFKDVWRVKGGWEGFLGMDYYHSWEEASEAAIALGIDQAVKYQKYYRKDKRLHPSPSAYYSNVWVANGRWSGFLGILGKYKTWEKASRAAIALGIKTSEEYKEKYKLDSLLPSAPWFSYSDVWGLKGGMKGFLGEDVVKKYEDFESASKAASKLDITTFSEYLERYKEDPKLPSSPQKVYKKDWVCWSYFLQKPMDSMELKKFLLDKGVSSELEYKRLNHPSLPKDPLSAFYLESFEQLFTLEVFGLKEAKRFCEKWNIKSAKQYDRIAAGQAHMPIAAQIKGYEHHEQIISKSRFDLIPAEYSVWREYAEKFSSKGAGLSAKQAHLVSFCINYLSAYKQPVNPVDFFSKKHSPPKIDGWLNSLSPSQRNVRVVNYINDFIRHVFLKSCCLVCEDTGEVTSLPDFTNHFEKRNVEIDDSQIISLGQSDKPPLPLHIVENTANWIAPQNAQSFSDLIDIRSLFSMDWYSVDEALIDKNDPDCVYREVDGVFEIWSPVRAIANLTLFRMPLRGQQILWLDSGEADAEKLIVKDGEKLWVKNDNPLASSPLAKGKQGFLRKFVVGKSTLTGAYVTTNKTGFKDGGFEIDWIPEELIPWIIRLRDWQAKYNPIERPSAWREIRWSRANPKDKRLLAQRGHQCFLFRDPTGRGPIARMSPNFTSKIFGTVLAGILAKVQTEEFPLAQVADSNKPDSVFNYKSEFTPHSLRVSHITALVLDYELPIPIVSKLVGHAQIVMTIYYTKTNFYDMRSSLDKGKKQALKKAPERLRALIMQKEFEEARSELVMSEKNDLRNLVSPDWPVAALIFKDFGICPYSSSNCARGGRCEVSGTPKNIPVKPGYLGQSNCIQCRFLITGPAFLGGLKALADDISLEISVISDKMEQHQGEIRELEDEKYDCEKESIQFTKSSDLIKSQDSYAFEAERFSVFTSDLVAIYRLSNLCAEALQKKGAKKFQLVVSDEPVNVEIMLEDVSEFRHLSEICQNAEFYSCSNPVRAIPKRSQMIDLFAQKNGIRPQMFAMTQEQQMTVGNQVTDLLLARLGGWDNIESVIDGRLKLSDFGFEENFELTKIEQDLTNLLDAKGESCIEGLKFIGNTSSNSEGET